MIRTLVVVTLAVISVPQMVMAQVQQPAGQNASMMNPFTHMMPQRQIAPPMPPGPYQGMAMPFPRLMQRPPLPTAYRMPPGSPVHGYNNRYLRPMGFRPMPMQAMGNPWQTHQRMAHPGWRAPDPRMMAWARPYAGRNIPAQSYAWRPSNHVMPHYSQNRQMAYVRPQFRAESSRYSQPMNQANAWRQQAYRPYAYMPKPGNPWQSRRNVPDYSHNKVAAKPPVPYQSWSRPVVARQPVENRRWTYFNSPAHTAYPMVRRASYFH